MSCGKGERPKGTGCGDCVRASGSRAGNDGVIRKPWCPGLGFHGKGDCKSAEEPLNLDDKQLSVGVALRGDDRVP